MVTNPFPLSTLMQEGLRPVLVLCRHWNINFATLDLVVDVKCCLYLVVWLKLSVGWIKAGVFLQLALGLKQHPLPDGKVGVSKSHCTPCIHTCRRKWNRGWGPSYCFRVLDKKKKRCLSLFLCFPGFPNSVPDMFRRKSLHSYGE